MSNVNSWHHNLFIHSKLGCAALIAFVIFPVSGQIGSLRPCHIPDRTLVNGEVENLSG